MEQGPKGNGQRQTGYGQRGTRGTGMNGDDSLELRYPKISDRAMEDENVKWLVQHGFKGVKDDAGEINHYRYDIHKPGRKESIVVVRAVCLPRWGWFAEAFNNGWSLAVQNGNSVCFLKNDGPVSGSHTNVKDSLLEIDVGIDRLIEKSGLGKVDSKQRG